MFWIAKLTLGHILKGYFRTPRGDMQINGVNKTHSLIEDSNFVINI